VTCIVKTPGQSLSPVSLKVKPGRVQFEQFKVKLSGLVGLLNASPNEVAVTISTRAGQDYISLILLKAFIRRFHILKPIKTNTCNKAYDNPSGETTNSCNCLKICGNLRNLRIELRF
jgi:hypothetical protein